MSAAPAGACRGAAAVADSQARETLRSANAAVGGAESGLRTALDKSFAYQAGFWVDTAYKTDLPKHELAFGSDDYFNLLAEHPEWAPYLAVSSNVIVVLDGTAYVVTDSGQPLAAAQPVDQPAQTAQPAAVLPEITPVGRTSLQSATGRSTAPDLVRRRPSASHRRLCVQHRPLDRFGGSAGRLGLAATPSSALSSAPKQSCDQEAPDLWPGRLSCTAVAGYTVRHRLRAAMFRPSL